MRAYKNTLLAIFVLGLTEIAVSQDVILKKDNTTVLSKVLEITNTEIKYKKWSNQDGPTYSISRSEVTSINYQNGDVDKFSDNAATTPVPQQTVVPQPQPQIQPPTPTVHPQPGPEQPTSPYSRSRVQFSLNAGVAFPMGQFAATSGEYYYCAPFALTGDNLVNGYGAAKTGFNASMRLHIPIYKQDKDIIGIPLKMNVMYNKITDEEKRSYRELWQYLGNVMNEPYDVNGYQFTITKYSNYINYSFMGCIDYTHYFSKSFGLFAEANLGLNIANITKSNMNNLLGGTLVYLDYENYIQYYSGDGIDISYKAKTNFAYELGGGLFLFNHFSVGVFYMGYSPFQVSPIWREYSSQYSNLGEGETLTAPKLKVSALSLQLGVHF